VPEEQDHSDPATADLGSWDGWTLGDQSCFGAFGVFRSFFLRIPKSFHEAAKQRREPAADLWRIYLPAPWPLSLGIPGFSCYTGLEP